MSSIRYSYISRSGPRSDRAEKIVEIFREREDEIEEVIREPGSGSNEILAIVRPGQEELGFDIEKSRKLKDKIRLSASEGRSDGPGLSFDVDGHHPDWQFVLELEGGRRDAIYKDIVKALLLDEASTLVLAVPNAYNYGDQTRQSEDRYNRAKRVANAIHQTKRFDSPCDIIVLGY